MKIISAKIKASHKGSLSGTFIHFVTTENVKLNEFFKVELNEKIYTFQPSEIETIGYTAVISVTAHEVGSLATKSSEKGIDPRSFINLDITKVTDPEEIKAIQTSSQYC